MLQTGSRTLDRAPVARRVRPIATRSKPLGALLCYAVVGVGNTAVSFATFVVLTAMAVPAPVAAALGFAAGALHGYLMNSRYTFRMPTGVRSGSLYVAVQAFGMALTAILVAILARMGAPEIVADGAAMPVVTLATYVLNSRWAFASNSPPLA